MKSVLVEDVGGAVKDVAHERGHVGGLPVIGDDPVPLAEHVSQAADAGQCRSHVPRRLHGPGQPLPGVALVFRGGAQVADEMGNLGWAAFALHEQHTVELQGRRAVEVFRTFVGAERCP